MPKGIYQHQKYTQKRCHNISKALIGIKRSKKTREKCSMAKSGDKNPRYKGNEASQEVIHKWVIKMKPKPEGCENCGRKRRLTLANLKKHKYTRNPEDYKWLCYSCHKKQDRQCSQCHKKEVKLHLVCDDCINWKNNFIKKLKEEIDYGRN
jgi:hypothetical protein